MTRKFFLHLFLFLLVLLSLWYGLSRLNFREIIKVEEKIQKLEKELNRWTLRFFQNEYMQIENLKIDSLLNQITHDLIHLNNFSHEEIEILLFVSEEKNAFALPGNTIIVFTGLIDFTKTPEEFLGIVAHEIAHVEQDHVVKKLSKELGLVALFSLLSGSNNLDVIREVAKISSSAAYDRNLEKEADRLAVDYLLKAGIDPRGFIEVLQRFAEDGPQIPDQLQWAASHPDALERADILLSVLDTVPQMSPKLLNPTHWNDFKATISNFN